MQNEIELFLKLKTDNTRRAYLSIIHDFMRFVGKKSLTEITHKDALRYLSAKEGAAGATIKHRYSVLRSLYEYFFDLGYVNKNPWRPVARAISFRQSAQVRPTKVLTPCEVVRLLKSIDTSTKRGVQDLAILSLLFGGGFRRSEILNMQIGDLQTTSDGILFADLRKTKAGKRQMQPIAKFAWAAISKFISQRKNDGAENEDPLVVFYYRDGRVRGKLDARTFARRFKKLCKKIGVDAAPHAARATYATQLKRAGAEDRVVAEALRHSTEIMVRVYDKRARGIEQPQVIGLNYADSQANKK